MFDASVMDADRGLAILAFKVGPNQFDLNRNLAYISMKDQVLRARTLVHSTVSSGLFEKRNGTPASFPDEEVDFDVLVVGAGVGGTSTALAAAECGLKVLMLEKNEACFHLLAQGTNRLISTTVYDWPAMHFDNHEFPVLSGLPTSCNPDAAILRFPKTPVQAGNLAVHLRNEFRSQSARFSENIQVEYRIALKTTGDVAWTQGRRLSVNLPREVDLGAKGKDKRLFARVVIFTTGFGSEKVTTKSKSSNDTFWGFETLERDLASLAEKFGDKTAKLAVLGAGDGGLQEVLRIALRPKFHDLVRAVDALKQSLDLPVGEWERTLHRIATAEDNAARALMWGYAQKVVYPALDAVYCSIIEALASGVNKPILDRWHEAVTRQQNVCIRLYDPYETSGRVYALNRFLVKLLTVASDGKTKGVRVTRSLDSDEQIQSDAPPIDRSGVIPQDGPIGTGEKDEILRRAAFRALPNHYGAVA